MFKAAIRVNKINTIAQLRGLTHHAERADEVGRARVREGAVAGDALAWSKAEGDRDYVAAFKAHKAELGAGERKNAPIAMQALCVVSPEWPVQQAGDLHDRANPRNIALFDQAKAWAESWAGKGAVFGVRLDLDEKGGAVVDLMIAPVRDSRGKPVISTQKPLTELKGPQASGMNTPLCRPPGRPGAPPTSTRRSTRLRRELTAREHLSPETYGMVMDKAREAVQRPVESLLGCYRPRRCPGTMQTNSGTTCCSVARSAATSRTPTATHRQRAPSTGSMPSKPPRKGASRCFIKIIFIFIICHSFFICVFNH